MNIQCMSRITQSHYKIQNTHYQTTTHNTNMQSLTPISYSDSNSTVMLRLTLPLFCLSQVYSPVLTGKFSKYDDDDDDDDDENDDSSIKVLLQSTSPKFSFHFTFLISSKSSSPFSFHLLHNACAHPPSPTSRESADKGQSCHFHHYTCHMSYMFNVQKTPCHIKLNIQHSSSKTSEHYTLCNS